MMQPSALLSRPLAMLAIAILTILCVLSVGESFKVITSSIIARRDDAGNDAVRRSWESEQGPFSPARPDDLHDQLDEINPINNGVAVPNEEADVSHDSVLDGEEKFGIPGLPLPNPIVTAISIVGPALGDPTAAPILPSTGAAGGGLFPSVLSILAGSPGATPAPVPGNPDGSAPLGDLLSALSQAAPSPVQPVPAITAPPAAPTGSDGLLSGLGVLGGVAAALSGVLGSPDDSSNDGSGLLGQISANVLGPVASIAADPGAILANPAAAVNDLQSQVSALLDSVPSAVAAGVQLASNVGGDLADALNATTDVLESVPDVADNVAGQVGSLLNAAPALASGIPAAALEAVNKVGAVLDNVPGLAQGFNGILAGLKNDLAVAVVSAAPEVSALAGAVNSQVVGVLPAALQPLVSGALSSLAMAPPSDGLSPSPTPTPSTGLASMLSSLSASITSASPAAAATGTAAVNSIASSALLGLSSLIGQVSRLSLTAATTPPATPATAACKCFPWSPK